MANVDFADTSDVNALLAGMDAEANAGSVQSPYWNPKGEGTTSIRFLKPLKNFNEQSFFKKHRIHYIGGRPYFCLNQSLTDKNGVFHEAENCPACKKASQMYSLATKGTPEWDAAGQIRAKDRFVSRILVRGKKGQNNEDMEWKPEFFEFGQKIFEAIKTAIANKQVGDFLSMKDGTDFLLSKKGQKKNTDYSGSGFSRQDTPALADVEKLKQMMAELPKMGYEQLVTFESAETISKALSDYLNGEDEEPVSKPSTAAPSFDSMDDAIYGSPVTPKAEEPAPAQNNELEDLLNSI